MGFILLGIIPGSILSIQATYIYIIIYIIMSIATFSIILITFKKTNYISELSGLSRKNYTLASNNLVTTGTILKKYLQIYGNDKNYDRSLVATVTISGTVSGDIILYFAQFADYNVGNFKPIYVALSGQISYTNYLDSDPYLIDYYSFEKSTTNGQYIYNLANKSLLFNVLHMFTSLAYISLSSFLFIHTEIFNIFPVSSFRSNTILVNPVPNLFMESKLNLIILYFIISKIVILQQLIKIIKYNNNILKIIVYIL